MNHILSERDGSYETWGKDFPIHIIEAETDLEDPRVFAKLSRAEEPKRTLVFPSLEFSKEDVGWREAFEDHMLAVRDSVLVSGFSPFTVEDYTTNNQGYALILHTPTQHRCTAIVVPKAISLDDLRILTPASMVVPSESYREETWDGTPVSVVESPFPIESATWIQFPDAEAPLQMMMALGDESLALHGCISKVSRRAVLSQSDRDLSKTPLEQAKYLMTQMHEDWANKEELSLTHGLVVILNLLDGTSSLSVARVSQKLTLDNILLLAPFPMIMARA